MAANDISKPVIDTQFGTFAIVLPVTENMYFDTQLRLRFSILYHVLVTSVKV